MYIALFADGETFSDEELIPAVAGKTPVITRVFVWAAAPRRFTIKVGSTTIWSINAAASVTGDSGKVMLRGTQGSSMVADNNAETTGRIMVEYHYD